MERLVLVILLAWQALGALATIHAIGKVRKPITHSQAVILLVVVILTMTGTCYVAGTLF